MDPNANLEEQRRLAEAILNESYASAETIASAAIRLAELVQALDEWISRGGFLPQEWGGK